MSAPLSVPRPHVTPARHRGTGFPGRWAHVYPALCRTLTTGMAILVPVEGESAIRLARWAMRKHVAAQGLLFRSVRDGAGLICWVEEMPSRFLERALRYR
jgi:hypothetical protein